MQTILDAPGVVTQNKSQTSSKGKQKAIEDEPDENEDEQVPGTSEYT